MFSKMKVVTRLALGFGSILLVLLALVSTAYYNFGQLSDANRWNVHTYEVMGEADAMLNSLINIETGERGFALAGDDAFLDPYRNGIAAFKKHSTQVKTLTADNPKQQERMDAIIAMQQDWVDKVLEPEIALRRNVSAGQSTIETVVASVRAAKGKQLMDGMRAKLAELRTAESDLLVIRSKDAEALHSRTNSVLIFGSLIAILLAAAIGYLLARSLTLVLGGEPAYAAEVMQRVAVGDFKVQVDTRPGDTTSMLFTVKQTVQAAGDSINDVVRVMSAMAQGDLTQSIDKPYEGSFGEMKDYVNATVTKLSMVVVEVNGGAESIASASEEVSATAQSLSQASSEQA
ncbi:CHASE3 domain-containing protein, partial [Variovorax ginsengisoli]